MRLPSLSDQQPVKPCSRSFAWLFALYFLMMTAAGAVQAMENHIVSISSLEDPKGSFTIEDVAGQTFKPEGKLVSKGYSPSVYWLKVVVKPTVPDQLLILRIRPTFLDEVRLYTPARDGSGWLIQTSGDRTPFLERPAVSTLSLNFKITPTEETTYFLRVATTSSVVVYAEALTENQSGQKSTLMNLAHLFLMSLIFAVSLWALKEFMVRREAVYLAFFFTQIFLIAYNLALSGYLAVLIPNSNLSDRLSSIIFVTTASVGVVMHYLFLKAFRVRAFVLRAFELIMFMAIPLNILLLMGEYKLALTINVLDITFLAVLYMLIPLTLRASAPPGRAVATVVYLLLGSTLFVSTTPYLGWFGSYTEMIFFGAPIQAFISACVFFAALVLRSRALVRKAAAAHIDLQLSQQALKLERWLAEERKQLMDMLTHELKTPIAITRLTVDGVSMEDSKRGRINRALQSINGIIERCSLSNQMEQDVIKVSASDLDLIALVRGLVEQSTAPERFEIEANEALVDESKVNSDRQLLSIVISNLLDNAVKYSQPSSSISLQIERHVADDKTTVLLHVTNEPGTAGLPDADQMFERYYRNQAARDVTGSGLGLYLVKGLCEKLNIHIAYACISGKARFTLQIPVVK